MTLARRSAAAGAAVVLATLALGAPAANAAPIADTTPTAEAGGLYHDWWYGQHGDGSLGNVSENNVGPAQACNNNVRVNVLGIQGAASDLAGVVGFDNDGNPSSTAKDCDQESYQDN